MIEKNLEFDILLSLPEDIIQKILNLASFNTKQIVQLSIISTNWRYFWKSLPVINIKIHDFSHTFSSKPTNFIAGIDKILTSYNDQDVHKFYLNSAYHSLRAPLLSKLVHFLILRNVHEIHLQESWIKIPILLVANLVNHNHNLRTLIVDFVHVEEDPEHPKLNLMSSSLETLIMSHDSGCITIHCERLKYFKIHNVRQDLCEVKLRAPNLSSIHCKGMFFHDYSLEDLSSMVDVDIDIVCMRNWDEKDVSIDCINSLLNLFQNVRSVSLTAGFFQAYEGVHDVWTGIGAFPNIKYLKVTKWNTGKHILTLAKFMEKFSSIESLGLQITQEEEWEQDEEEDYDGKDWDTLLAFPCNYYTLKSLDIQFLEGEENELLFIEFLLKGAPALQSITITTTKTISQDKWKMLSLWKKLHSLPSYCSATKISIN